jgi:hypothetical protein
LTFTTKSFSKRLATKLTPQNLANIVHAFSTAGVSHPNLYKTVSAESMLHLNDFNSQEIANITWSMAKAKDAEPRLFNLVAKLIMGRLDSFVEVQHLSNIIWAFATSKIVHKPLFEAVADIASRERKNFRPSKSPT